MVNENEPLRSGKNNYATITNSEMDREDFETISLNSYDSNSSISSGLSEGDNISCNSNIPEYLLSCACSIFCGYVCGFVK